MEFDDFDAQSEQLDGYDQEYIKISTDPFRGRFVSAFLAGDVSVHYETVNCAMYQRVSCPEGVIGFGLSLAQPESVVNGLKSAAVFTATRDALGGPGGVRLPDAVRCNRQFPQVDPVGHCRPLSTPRPRFACPVAFFLFGQRVCWVSSPAILQPLPDRRFSTASVLAQLRCSDELILVPALQRRP